MSHHCHRYQGDGPHQTLLVRLVQSLLGANQFIALFVVWKYCLMQTSAEKEETMVPLSLDLWLSSCSQLSSGIRRSASVPKHIQLQVQQFHKAGDTGEADSAPLMSILYSGSQWFLGAPIGEQCVWVHHPFENRSCQFTSILCSQGLLRQLCLLHDGQEWLPGVPRCSPWWMAMCWWRFGLLHL